MPKTIFDLNKVKREPADIKIEVGKCDDEEEEKDPVTKGRETGVEEFIKEGVKEIEKFESLVTGSKKILFEASSKFPFNFFEDRIKVDLNKVNVSISDFLKTKRIYNIFIKELTEVLVESGPIFSTLVIKGNFEDKELRITSLAKKDAEKARKIIQGLIIARKEIELNQLESIPEVEKKLEKLGESFE